MRAGSARHIERGADDHAIALGIRDVMVGGKNGEQSIAARGVAHVERGQCDGGGGVAADGFGEHATSRGSGQLLAYFGGLLGVGDRPDSFRRNEGPQTRDGLLQHGVFADDIEELLGRARAAARPEAGAAASGENDGVNAELCRWPCCRS